MVRATGRHTSRLYRYGCRGGATAARFWSLNDKTIFQAVVRSYSSPKAGRASLAWLPSIDGSDKRRFFAVLHLPPVTSSGGSGKGGYCCYGCGTQCEDAMMTWEYELKPVTFTDLKDCVDVKNETVRQQLLRLLAEEQAKDSSPLIQECTGSPVGGF